MSLKPNALAVGQRQQLVVIHHGIHVFHPQGVHITIKQNVPAATEEREPGVPRKRPAGVLGLTSPRLAERLFPGFPGQALRQSAQLAPEV